MTTNHPHSTKHPHSSVFSSHSRRPESWASAASIAGFVVVLGIARQSGHSVRSATGGAEGDDPANDRGHADVDAPGTVDDHDHDLPGAPGVDGAVEIADLPVAGEPDRDGAHRPGGEDIPDDRPHEDAP